MTDPLYQEYILDLYRRPHNKQALEKFDIKQYAKNPLCSDEIYLYIKFGADGRVSNVGYDGDGCAISTAATSLLTDFMKGKTSDELKELTVEKMLALLGLPNIAPARVGCATLAHRALQKSLTG